MRFKRPKSFLMSDNSTQTVEDDERNSKFVLHEQGDTCYADYRRDPGKLTIKYVFAPDALRGTGAAGRLMAGIVDYARKEDRKIVPICGYAAAWLRRHSETHDLLA